MKKVYIQTRLVSSVGHCHQLLNINGGFVAWRLFEYNSLDEAYDAAQQENIAMIHEAAIAENERVESSRIGGEKI